MIQDYYVKANKCLGYEVTFSAESHKTVNIACYNKSEVKYGDYLPSQESVANV